MVCVICVLLISVLGIFEWIVFDCVLGYWRIVKVNKFIMFLNEFFVLIGICMINGLVLRCLVIIDIVCLKLVFRLFILLMKYICGMLWVLVCCYMVLDWGLMLVIVEKIVIVLFRMCNDFFILMVKFIWFGVFKMVIWWFCYVYDVVVVEIVILCFFLSVC